MFQIETGLIIWSSISFGILVFLLYKFLLPPILNMIDEREGKIKEALSAAEDTKKEAGNLLDEYRKKLDESRKIADQIIENSKSESQMIIKDAVERSKNETKIILNQAKSEIEAARKKMIKDVKNISADLVVLAASKVIEKNLKKEDNLALISEIINEKDQL